MSEIRRRLIPQFSLRRILGLISTVAVGAFVVSSATRGATWGAGLSIGLLAIALAFAVFIVLFAAAWGLSLLRRKSGRKNRASKIIAGLLVFVCCFGLGRRCAAASGGTITLPILATGQTNKTGLELKLDTIWIDAAGYRPIRVQVRSIAGPVTADRVLTLRFRPHLGFTQQNSVVVEENVEIAAGSETASVTLSTPQLGAWGSFEFEVLEDGQYVEQLSIGANSTWTSWSGSDQGDAQMPTVLELSDTTRAPVEMAVGGHSPELLVVRGDSKTAAAGSSKTTKDWIEAEDLPKKWIDYSGVDVVLTSQTELLALAEKHRAAWEAMQEWLRNGGNLIVYGEGSDWRGLGELARAMDVKNSESEVDTTELNLEKRGWKLPTLDLRKDELIETGGQKAVPDPTVPNGSTQPAIESIAEKNVTAAEAPFVMRPVGLGMVVAIRSDSKFDGSKFQWAWLLNTLGSPRWQWFQRWGVSLNRENIDFWNFLIPGVGLARVSLFQVLITLFMLAIGPVNYLLLKRWGKLNLMVLTVPAGALVVTAAIVSAALLADGLGVRLRARSITQIDQQAGEATCWARLSYYAGLAPGSGLKFSERTAVIPLNAQPEWRSNDKLPVRTVDWWRQQVSDANSLLEQRLTEGWIAARTPTQFMTSHIGKTKAHLEITPAEDSSQPPRVVNRLNSAIAQLLLVDESGHCFVGKEIADGGTAAMEAAPSQHEGYQGGIGPLVAASQPDLSPAMTYNGGHRSVFGLGGRFRDQYMFGSRVNFPGGASNDGGMPAASQSTGELEREIHETVDALNEDRLPGRTYVAIVKKSPVMEEGIEGAVEEASFHMVVGHW